MASPWAEAGNRDTRPKVDPIQVAWKVWEVEITKRDNKDSWPRIYIP